MAVNVAALTLMCLAFSTGFLLVVSFIQKPIFPLAASPLHIHEHESDVRWIHGLMKSFLNFSGPGMMVPVTAFAVLTAVAQTWMRGYDVVSVFLAIGTGVMLVMASLVATPAARKVAASKTYEDDLQVIAAPLFRLARMHHTMLLALIPLTLAQLALLFY